MGRSIALLVSMIGILGGISIPATANVSFLTWEMGRGWVGVNGTLSVNGLNVSYNNPKKPDRNFNLSCIEFAAQSSHAYGSLEVHTRIRNYHFNDNKKDRHDKFYPIYQGILDDCASKAQSQLERWTHERANTRDQLGRLTGREVPADPEASYQVVRNFPYLKKQGQGTLSVASLVVKYTDANQSAYDFIVPCDEFTGTTVTWAEGDLNVQGQVFTDNFRRNKSDSVSFAPTKEVYEEITGHCRNLVEVHEAQKRELADLVAKKDAEDRASAQKQAEANVDRELNRQRDAQAQFQGTILKAWQAKKDQEPFLTIRGHYDLSAADTRHWTTGLVLPEANSCYLLRSGPAAQSTALWTYVCEFPAEIFERLVGLSQSALNIPFQPDQAAISGNQVFFRDQSTAPWRLVVTKLPNQVMLRIGVDQQVQGLPEMSAANNGKPMSIGEEIEGIVKSGRYTALPMPSMERGSPAAAGIASLTIQNDTSYSLTVLLSGPVEQRMEIPARSSASVTLATGTYKAVGRVNDANVLPSYGQYQLDGVQGIKFYIP
jgi:hypothetical protein